MLVQHQHQRMVGGTQTRTGHCHYLPPSNGKGDHLVLGIQGDPPSFVLLHRGQKERCSAALPGASRTGRVPATCIPAFPSSGGCGTNGGVGTAALRTAHALGGPVLAVLSDDTGNRTAATGTAGCTLPPVHHPFATSTVRPSLTSRDIHARNSGTSVLRHLASPSLRSVSSDVAEVTLCGLARLTPPYSFSAWPYTAQGQ